MGDYRGNSSPGFSGTARITSRSLVKGFCGSTIWSRARLEHLIHGSLKVAPLQQVGLGLESILETTDQNLCHFSIFQNIFIVGAQH